MKHEVNLSIYKMEIVPEKYSGHSPLLEVCATFDVFYLESAVVDMIGYLPRDRAVELLKDKFPYLFESDE